MARLARYVRPYVLFLVLAVLFVFAQAACDLSLPDYMSDIVNKGIQQGGVADDVPEAVGRSRMDRVLLFIGGEDREKVLDSYALVDVSSPDYEKYVKKYPALSSEPVYVKKELSSGREGEIRLPMARAILAAAGIEKAIGSANGGAVEFGGYKLPAGTDIFALISRMPEQQREKIAGEINAKFSSLGDSMVLQAAAAAIRDEYGRLGMDTGAIQTSYILRRGALMLAVTALSAVCTVLVAFFGSKVAAGVARDLRSDVFKRAESFSLAEFDRFSTSSLITRTTNDIAQIQMLLLIMIRMVFYAPAMGVGGVFKAVGKSHSMTWIIALAVAVILCLVLVLYLVAVPKFRLMQKLIDRLNLVARENLSGIMVVRAFNAEKFEEQRFDEANRDLTKVGLFVNRAMAVMFPTMMLVMNGVTLLIVWIGAHQIESSAMQVGDMLAFMQYSIQIIFAFLMMSAIFIMIPRASVSAQRIAEVLATEPSVKDPPEPKSLDSGMRGAVEFKNVSFRYPSEKQGSGYVLKDVSFKILPGQTVGVIGRTGSGKSTLVSLIMRFYDATEGQVLFNGVDVREASQADLRSRIGFAPQKSWLFSGTIASNLRYGRPEASEQELLEATDIAQALEFINEKPDKLETEIAQGGTNVSGGQRQRLSIARALVKKPELYIFDESFSALDFTTELKLRKKLREKLRGSTVVMVSQRVATMMDADLILVLEEGRLVGAGTHRELMAACRTYRDIAVSQLPEEELPA